ncbi:MAG: efflux RND transporter periplasmic adaptor subunit [Deltaproteobacteria bacterium]|nr:efflux RND transporter periplasmic adaptor subunit [Deltaproteobacteria bacterium]
MTNWRLRVRSISTGVVAVAGVAAAIYYAVLQPIDVRSHPVVRGTVLVEALGTGSVESHRTASVSFEVTGRVTMIHVDQGDRVKEGQVLAAIDDRTFQAEIALAEQDVELAKSTLRRLEADITRAEPVLKGADDGLERIRSLAARGAASEEDLDVAEERMKVAVAELSRAQAAQREGHQAIAAAARRLDRARAEFDRTIVRSPFDGVVIRREREVGDVAVPGAAVLSLAATDTVWASVWVDETYLGSLSVGLPARILLRSEPERTLRGTVSRIGREVDRETRELLVDVAFDAAPETLVFGQRVDLWIELTRASAVLRIPSGSVARVGDREGAFVSDGSRASFRPLEFGRRGRELVEVVRGLSEGDVVLDPSIGRGKSLEDGDRIRLLSRPGEEGRP